MRRSYGRIKGQKGRIRDFVKDRPFTVPELKEAVARGLIQEVEPRNIDRYVATMCWTGEAERTGSNVRINGRNCKQYRVVRPAAMTKTRPSVRPDPVVSAQQITTATFQEARLRIERVMSDDSV